MDPTSKQSDSRESRLLSLPPEVRNMIYRYTLIEGIMHIRYPHDRPALPGLLQVNEQLRSEAVDIYYKENEFRFHIDHFDADGFIKWCRSSKARLRSTKTFNAIKTGPQPFWLNLKTWLRAFYRGWVTGINAAHEDNLPVGNAAGSWFRADSDWVNEGLVWEEVEENLERMHAVLAVVDKTWASPGAEVNWACNKRMCAIKSSYESFQTSPSRKQLIRYRRTMVASKKPRSMPQ